MYNVCGAGSNKIFNVALREKRLPTPDVHNKYVSGKFTTKIYLIEQFFSNIHVFDKLWQRSLSATENKTVSSYV